MQKSCRTSYFLPCRWILGGKLLLLPKTTFLHAKQLLKCRSTSRRLGFMLQTACCCPKTSFQHKKAAEQQIYLLVGRFIVWKLLFLLQNVVLACQTAAEQQIYLLTSRFQVANCWFCPKTVFSACKTAAEHQIYFLADGF